jgi:large conductance mechanosensitive channel
VRIPGRQGDVMSRDFLDRENIIGYGKRGFHAGWSTLGDFRKFLLRGNVVDLAVGVVIGAAFNGLVQEIVKALITPLLGLLVNVSDFSNLNVSYHKQTFAFGDLLNTTISFIITAAVVYFLVVKPINLLEDRYNRLLHKDQVAVVTRECPYCLSTIPLKATRCSYCTSQLPPPTDPVQTRATPAGY